MQQHTFIICFIIFLISVLINGGNHYDSFSLFKPSHQRRSSSFPTAEDKFRNQVLEAHNTYRSRHCTPPLALDDDMSRSAQKYAEHLARTNSLVHSDLLDLGENLFKVASSHPLDDFDGAEAVRSWYDEIKYYDINNPKFSEEAGHFTQVLWKESKKLGVGYATSRSNSQYMLYVVAQYSPPGNEDDYFADNVLRAKC